MATKTDKIELKCTSQFKQLVEARSKNFGINRQEYIRSLIVNDLTLASKESSNHA